MLNITSRSTKALSTIRVRMHNVVHEPKT